MHFSGEAPDLWTNVISDFAVDVGEKCSQNGLGARSLTRG